ncbi:glycine/betaine ABC transporter substrate-binding protein [Ameyamaea chiangmaiensis]|uniref:Glycine/betaine ABC transporter substrate-binding protein n=1 Tax=Ameyamaea chiangmaiensis TaxID=442969 RepID=A0A850PBD3_9PROT|nr:glycine betaine ABC transporter substrate-binding protein [Ameyamaea chiangmaiensis]MBS4076065.1 glycine/betaine ABC transporter substrate-binding protein [Ameyamaea chiangmaiensis]NVN39840.1 glycine/betaine ABC transporter substrate-binding protein [Ameyamaea chiangmaiensis]
MSICRGISALAALCMTVVPVCAMAETPSCGTVRIAEAGWTDNAVATGIAAELLDMLGYHADTPLVTVSLAYVSMQSGKIDAFLGAWKPAGERAIAPYLADGSLRLLATNLADAHYTLAVPDETWKAGLHDFRDISRFGARLGYVIYGLEAGNSGNVKVLSAITHNDLGLGRFRLIESSEQGMLSQVQRDIDSHRPIVFMGWEPHPMNQRFQMHYLTGGDAYFGPDHGASVRSVIRAGYDTTCPNVTRLLKNLKFSIPMENRLMQVIHDQHLASRDVARAWLRAHPQSLASWLDGVTTFDGKPAWPAVKAVLVAPAPGPT